MRLTNINYTGLKTELLNSHRSWPQIREKTRSVGSILHDIGLIYVEVQKNQNPPKEKNVGVAFFNYGIFDFFLEGCAERVI